MSSLSRPRPIAVAIARAVARLPRARLFRYGSFRLSAPAAEWAEFKRLLEPRQSS